MTARHITQPQEKKSNTLFVCLSSFFLLVLGNIFFSVQTLQVGLEISALEKEKAQLLKEKTQLSEQLSKHNTLTDIAQSAQEQGYESITHTVAITIPSDSSVALR